MAHQGVNTLAYAIRGSVIAKYGGRLCGVLAVLNLAPLIVSLVYNETLLSMRYFIIVAALTLTSLTTLHLQIPSKLQVNEALVITILAFAAAAITMVYPFVGAGLPWLDALFEAVSGVTTTGLSTVADVEIQPHSFLFARAWLQWYCGLAIIVLSLVLLSGPGIAARRLAAAGGDVDDIIGTSGAYAQRMLAIYMLLTVFGITITMALGQDAFNATLHILSAVSTGGYSSFNTSLNALDGWAPRVAVLVVCVSGALPLALYYQAWQYGWRQLANDREVQTLLLCIGLITLVLWMNLLIRHTFTPTEALIQTAATVVSAQTTSGFSTVNIADLDTGSKGILIIAMALGGGMGSSAGGIKITRLLILLRLLQILLLRTALPTHAVAEPHLGGHRLESAEIQHALFIILLYVSVIFLSWLLFLIFGYDPLNALFEVVSATATVGLSVGITSQDLHPLLKGILCIDMLMGRLEVFALLVLCYPATWFGRKQ